MSTALDHTRARFETTPRALEDDELVRIARGDRGCLGDLVSGLGAVLLISAAILGAMGRISFTWTYVAAAVWIGGFVWGTVAQTRSGKLRKAALEQGPLVMAVVLRSEDCLQRPGKRVGRAVVAFTTADGRRFDREGLDALAAALEAGKDSDAARASEWVALLDDPDAFGVFAVEPAVLGPGLAGRDDSEAGAEDCWAEDCWVAAMHVHPERLDGDYLGYLEDCEAAERELELDAPTRAPTVLAIVDPERGFIEQVPRAPARSPSEAAAAADDEDER